MKKLRLLLLAFVFCLIPCSVSMADISEGDTDDVDVRDVKNQPYNINPYVGRRLGLARLSNTSMGGNFTDRNNAVSEHVQNNYVSVIESTSPVYYIWKDTWKAGEIQYVSNSTSGMNGITTFNTHSLVTQYDGNNTLPGDDKGNTFNLAYYYLRNDATYKNIGGVTSDNWQGVANDILRRMDQGMCINNIGRVISNRDKAADRLKEWMYAKRDATVQASTGRCTTIADEYQRCLAVFGSYLTLARAAGYTTWDANPDYAEAIKESFSGTIPDNPYIIEIESVFLLNNSQDKSYYQYFNKVPHTDSHGRIYYTDEYKNTSQNKAFNNNLYFWKNATGYSNQKLNNTCTYAITAPQFFSMCIGGGVTVEDFTNFKNKYGDVKYTGTTNGGFYYMVKTIYDSIGDKNTSDAYNLQRNFYSTSFSGNYQIGPDYFPLVPITSSGKTKLWESEVFPNQGTRRLCDRYADYGSTLTWHNYEDTRGDATENIGSNVLEALYAYEKGGNRMAGYAFRAECVSFPWTTIGYYWDIDDYHPESDIAATNPARVTDISTKVNQADCSWTDANKMHVVLYAMNKSQWQPMMQMCKEINNSTKLKLDIKMYYKDHSQLSSESQRLSVNISGTSSDLLRNRSIGGQFTLGMRDDKVGNLLQNQVADFELNHPLSGTFPLKTYWDQNPGTRRFDCRVSYHLNIQASLVYGSEEKKIKVTEDTTKGNPSNVSEYSITGHKQLQRKIIGCPKPVKGHFTFDLTPSGSKEYSYIDDDKFSQLMTMKDIRCDRTDCLTWNRDMFRWINYIYFRNRYYTNQSSYGIRIQINKDVERMFDPEYNIYNKLVINDKKTFDANTMLSKLTGQSNINETDIFDGILDPEDKQLVRYAVRYIPWYREYASTDSDRAEHETAFDDDPTRREYFVTRVPMTYTHDTNDTTGKLYGELKEGSVYNESYEAMAGVPTTENLYFYVGGQEFIANITYTSHYARTTQVDAKTAKRFNYVQFTSIQVFKLNGCNITGLYKITNGANTLSGDDNGEEISVLMRRFSDEPSRIVIKGNKMYALSDYLILRTSAGDVPLFYHQYEKDINANGVADFRSERAANNEKHMSKENPWIYNFTHIPEGGYNGKPTSTSDKYNTRKNGAHTQDLDLWVINAGHRTVKPLRVGVKHITMSNSTRNNKYGDFIGTVIYTQIEGDGVKTYTTKYLVEDTTYNVNNIVVHDPVAIQSSVSGRPDLDQRAASVKQEQTSKGVIELVLGNTFKVHFDTIGDFKGNNAYGLKTCQNIPGKGYNNNMQVKKWTQRKYIKFPFKVEYEGHAYAKDEDINLSLDKNEFTFKVLVNNLEYKEVVPVFGVEALNSPNMNGLNNTEINNKLRTDFKAEHDAKKTYTVDVIGRLGDLTIIDTGDYRFSNMFKEPTEDWLIPNLLHKVDPSRQKGLVGDIYNVLKQTDTHNPLGTLNFKDNVAYAYLPLTPAKNTTNDAFKLQPLRIGYTTYLSEESVGNYYGDGRDHKLQIRPKYYMLRLESDGTTSMTPVDVYALEESRYKKIYDFADDNNAYTDSNWYYSLDWENEYERRMFEGQEAQISNSLNSSPKSCNIGTANYLFMRKDAMSYCGITDNQEDMKQGQRWHFKISLPANSKFIPKGETFTLDKAADTIKGTTVLLCSLRSAVSGSIWTLFYKNETSYDNVPIVDNWHPDIPTPDPEIPTLVMSTDKTARDDSTIKGTH